MSILDKHPSPDLCPWCGEVVAGAFTCLNGFSLHSDCYREIDTLKAKGG